MNDTFLVSKTVIDILKSMPKDIIENEEEIYKIGDTEFHLKESSLFPIEVTFDACDIETREPIKISSGEFIHGAVVPKFNPLEIEKPNIVFFK